VQEVSVPVPVVRPREVVIAEEQDYLFHSVADDLQAPEWSDAACRDAEPDVFFPLTAHDVASRREALSWCGICAIAPQCREIALRDPSIVGIWGGTDEVERARLRGRRLVSVA
jgi:WhiB family transcriptional regulator, redox-sensing transcriptional regulator